MLMLNENDPDVQCFIKARRKGEPTFTLRAQDKSAAAVVSYWLLINRPFLSEAKIAKAEADIKKLEAWPAKKQAD